MEKEKLKKIAKTHKLNLDHFDSVFAFINEAFTKVFITFANTEVVGGEKFHCNRTDLKLSVSAILKRCEDLNDYTTNGWTYLYEIR